MHQAKGENRLGPAMGWVAGVLCSMALLEALLAVSLAGASATAADVCISGNITEL